MNTRTTSAPATANGDDPVVRYAPLVAICIVVLGMSVIGVVNSRPIFRQQVTPAVSEIKQIIADAKDIREVEARIDSFCNGDKNERVIETSWMTTPLQLHWTCMQYTWDKNLTTVYVSVRDRAIHSADGTLLEDADQAFREGGVAIGVDGETLQIKFTNYYR